MASVFILKAGGKERVKTQESHQTCVGKDSGEQAEWEAKPSSASVISEHFTEQIGFCCSICK